MKGIKTLDCRVDGDKETEDFKSLINFLWPEMGGKDGHIIVSRMAGGFANDVFRLKSPSSPERSFVMRVFRGAEGYIVNRDKEVAVQWLLAANGLGAEVLCRFKNGICYQFIEGEPLTLDWILESIDNSMFVGEKMASLHDLQWSSLDFESFRNDTSFMWLKMHDFVNYVETKFPDVFSLEKIRGIYGSSANIRRLIEELRGNIDKYKDHPACSLSMCHNDLLFSNMIFDQSTKNFSFIDFEYADINYSAFDIGNFFCEFAGVDPIDSIDYGRFPSREYQLKWIKHYLRHRKSTKSLSEIEIDRLGDEYYVIVQKLSLASHLFWSLMVLIQSQVLVGVTYDYVRYGGCRLAEFHRRKETVLAMDI